VRFEAIKQLGLAPVGTTPPSNVAVEQVLVNRTEEELRREYTKVVASNRAKAAAAGRVGDSGAPATPKRGRGRPGHKSEVNRVFLAQTSSLSQNNKRRRTGGGGDGGVAGTGTPLPHRTQEKHGGGEVGAGEQSQMAGGGDSDFEQESLLDSDEDHLEEEPPMLASPGSAVARPLTYSPLGQFPAQGLAHARAGAGGGQAPGQGLSVDGAPSARRALS